VWHILKSEDTFSDEHSLDEPSDVDFSEVTRLDELIDPIFDESLLNLAPTPPISPTFFLPFPIFSLL